MIKSITADNVNNALLDALWWLKTTGVVTQSRNGAVLAAPRPVATTYLRPNERVMFSALRDANPFFHLMESIWMLSGRNDVAFPATYAKQIAQYSDDGETLHGAYGHRWREYFGYDQLSIIIEMLRKDPLTRRAVLAMWNAFDGNPPTHDLLVAESGGKDVPCNTHVYFSGVRGVLDMTVCCRSNDAIWGCYGANAVHFSMLHQFIAEASGMRLGAYTQFSNNLHVYLDRPDVERLLNFNGGILPTPPHDRCDVVYRPDNRYLHADFRLLPLIAAGESYKDFLDDAEYFIDNPDDDVTYRTTFFNHVITPMQIAHTAYKAGNFKSAMHAVGFIAAEDWRMACVEWLGRRCGGAV